MELEKIPVQTDYPLKDLHTFRMEVQTKYFQSISDLGELRNAIQFAKDKCDPILFLGGGSNILFKGDFNGLVIKNEFKGIEILSRSDNEVIIEVMSGENWHETVLYTIENNLGGLENLSLIPGTVGAAPMQNIGAYGVEVKDTIQSIKAFNLDTNEVETFDNESCAFEYRESVFKKDLKDKYFILSVTFKLTTESHTLHIEYGAIKDVLIQNHITNPTIKDVSDAVISIRQSKLPDPAVIPNAGSFFKNPYICLDHYNGIKEKYADLPMYPTANPDVVKVPAGWLIEKCGWKGKQIGNVGVHANQALVLVNYGGGKGNEIVDLSQNIQNPSKIPLGLI